jgi:uncharacterized membrane protein YjgN (DUF898 family)
MNETMLFSFTPPPAAAAGPARVTFTGRRADFRRMIVRGAALELITVGFYRFWLATDMRRHLWSNTAVDGDAAEYTGTAKELLIGFLFALAILAPIYLAYFLVGLEAERIKAFASFPLVVFFYLFAQFAIYRARRYRLTRTVWRGVRFWMTGSGWSYAWRAGLWMLFSLITLGIALPWAKASLERYKMRHTSYGELHGRFEGTGGGLFKQVWWLWLLMWPSVLVVIPLPFIYAAMRAIEWRWWVNGLRIGDVGFSSDLKNGAFIGLYWKVIGWCTLLFVGFLIAAGIAFLLGYLSLGANLSNLSDEQRFLMATQNLPFMLTLGVAYVVSALALGVVIRIYLMRDLWQRVAASVTVDNLESAENIAAQGHLVSALGEGFADSLDVAGF